MAGTDSHARSLSRKEAELVGWLEAERRASVSTSDVRETLGWPDVVTRNVMSRLAKKGWIRRTAHGRYETILAETGGWSSPNPWAALSDWGQRYYIGFNSAAYEHGLTPDRPGSLQVCVAVGAKRPQAWREVPIALIFFPKLDETGVETKELHGFHVRIASVEKLLADGAARPGRMGGVLGLARVLGRALDGAAWEHVASLARTSPRGRVGLRRMAALIQVLGHEVPDTLAFAATAQPGESPIFLAERGIHGARGSRLSQWQVVVNLDPSVLREEVSR